MVESDTKMALEPSLRRAKQKAKQTFLAPLAAKKRVLIIAGTDPTGGAGIVRDITTCHDFGVDVSIALTAINAQNDKKVVKVLYQESDFLSQQIESVLSAQKIDAIKIGMIGTASNVHAIANLLKQYRSLPVICDPVLVASSGGALAKADLVPSLLQKLLPHLSLLTPNLPELAMLTNKALATSQEEAIAQARFLIETYQGQAILVKGGHSLEAKATDILVTKEDVHSFTKERLPIAMRGTGCILSTAIAAQLTDKAIALPQAIETAKAYLFSLLLKAKAP